MVALAVNAARTHQLDEEPLSDNHWTPEQD